VRGFPRAERTVWRSGIRHSDGVAVAHHVDCVPRRGWTQLRRVSRDRHVSSRGRGCARGLSGVARAPRPRWGQRDGRGGDLAGEPLHFERVADGFRASAVRWPADSVAARATIERVGGASAAWVRWLVPRARAPRERLTRRRPVQGRIATGGFQQDRDLVGACKTLAHEVPVWHEPFVRPRSSAVTGRFGVARIQRCSEPSHGRRFRRPARRTGGRRTAAVSPWWPIIPERTTVLIDHGAGLVTGYLHLSRALVASGNGRRAS